MLHSLVEKDWTLTMGERLSHAARVLRIRELLDCRPFVTLKSLEEEFEVSKRTLYNDLHALQEAGVPIFSEPGPDREARWQLVSVAKKQPVTVSKRQLVPLDLAKLALSFLSGTTAYGHVEETLRRLARGLGPEAKAAFDKVPKKLAVIPHGPKSYRNKDGILDDLLVALLDEHRVEIEYRPPGARKRRYTVAPLTLLIYREALYMMAAFGKAETLGPSRTFAVDRIVGIKRLPKEGFVYPEDHDPHGAFDGAFGLIYSGDEEDVELLFDAGQAAFVQERQWHSSQTFSKDKDGRVRMKMRVKGLTDVYRWLVGHMDSVEVVAPEGLRKRVLAAVGRGKR
ncbi:MAG: transcriptional regulator [Deltaproteobacteria bacterium]|nr:transcriptional regulator [Deltaproteobacteria bacterium]